MHKLATPLPICIALICGMLKAEFTNGKQRASKTNENRLASGLMWKTGIKIILCFHFQCVTLHMLPIIKYHLSSHISLHVPTNLHIYTYIYMFIHVFVLHMHDLQNEQLNKQGERFKENVILKFHIYHEQWHKCPEDKDLIIQLRVILFMWVKNVLWEPAPLFLCVYLHIPLYRYLYLYTGVEKY